MPTKKGKDSKKKTARFSDEEDSLPKIDVQYNPEIVKGLLQELELQLEMKCNQIQKDSDFMVTSIQQAFHLELIKLPNQVKQMSLARFQEEFGDSLEAVTRGAIGGNAVKSGLAPAPKTIAGSAMKSSRSSTRIFQTPSAAMRSNVAMRNPREGEKILSENGSPLGEFNTLVKAPKFDHSSIIPPTPGVFVPLASGELLDIDSVDAENLPETLKQDALAKMEAMMANMQTFMTRLKK
jgi:hypothetical protein